MVTKVWNRPAAQPIFITRSRTYRAHRPPEQSSRMRVFRCTNLGRLRGHVRPNLPDKAHAMGSLGASQLVDLLVGGLAVGCVYSLVALGFAMIMRATSIIHFAQGEVMMLGCMCGLTSMWLLPMLPVLLVVAAGMVSSAVVAVAMELAVYRTLRAPARADHEYHHRHRRHVHPVHQCSADHMGLRAAALSGAVCRHGVRARRRAHLAAVAVDHGHGVSPSWARSSSS